MAKEDALTQLHIEKRLRASAEDRCDDLSRKLAELETQLHVLQTAGHVQVRICLITNFFSVCCLIFASVAAVRFNFDRSG